MSDIMRAVLSLAVQNVKKGYGPFAAAIVKNGKILVSASNGVTKLNDPTAHAEIRVIREACKMLHTYDLSGYDLYTSCEPCVMCFGAIYWAGIKRVFYSATNEDARKAGFDDSFIMSELDKWIGNDTKNMYVKIRRLEKADCFKPFDEWNNFADKKEY